METPKRKLTLGEWAQIGEVVGVFAVLLSVILVVISINQNTTALRGATGNLIFELLSELQAKFIENPGLAALMVKAGDPDATLNDVERLRWTKYRHNMIDLWAMAYQRNMEGLYSDAEWNAWNDYFVHVFSEQAERMSEQEWRDWSYGWDAPFWRFVGTSLNMPVNDL